MEDILNTSEKAANGRPRKYENFTAELLNERANAYFRKCDSRTKIKVTKDGEVVQIPDPMPYSIEGLCSYLDILRSEFAAWRKQDSDLGRRANLIHQTITADRVTGALEGRQNSAFAQFMLKNNNPEEYRDKVDVEHSASSELASIFDLAQTMKVSAHDD